MCTGTHAPDFKTNKLLERCVFAEKSTSNHSVVVHDTVHRTRAYLKCTMRVGLVP